MISVLKHITLWLAISMCFILVDVAWGQVPDSQIRFVDITKSSGVSFKHQDGSDGNRYLIELMGAGVCSFDADRDGLVDLFC